ncbi:single strand DNA binding protein [Proteus phage Myduc]|uniref:Putative ssDNA binding protein n=1 Tax=Proteus phage Myduc TaxID=2650874 RepID=A0A5J6TAV2_9CAUD|nr:single strand DNA binding protein [Proteus phage Myduc]QFG06646.1 putative ssDNA binding protein [Proteus phage Myduc]
MSNENFNDLNRGFVMNNERRENDKQPNVTGRVNVNGIWYFVSMWNGTTSTGKWYSSMALTEMTQQQVDSMMAKRKQRPQGQQQQPQQAQQTQQPQHSGVQQQQTQHQQTAQSQIQNQQEPPMDFDDDIPF